MAKDSINSFKFHHRLNGVWSGSNTLLPSVSSTNGTIQLYPPHLIDSNNGVNVFESYIQLTNGKFGNGTSIDYFLFFVQHHNESNAKGYVVSKQLTSVPLRVIRKNLIHNNITTLIENLPHVEIEFSFKLNQTTIIGNITNGYSFIFFSLKPFNSLEFEEKVIPYIGLIIFFAIYESYYFVEQIDYSNTESLLKKTSCSTFVFIAALDAFQSHIHVYFLSFFSFESFAFRLTVLCSILYFLHFCIFDVKFVFNIWKTHFGKNSQNSTILIYFQLYLPIFLLFILSVFSVKYFLIINFSMWVPQIYQNIVSNSTNAIGIKSIIHLTIPRLLTVLCWIIFPINYINYGVDSILIGKLLLWIKVQIMLIIIQKKYGPRVFLPRFILQLFVHEEYNYHHGWKDIVSIRGEQECVICMNKIDNTYMKKGCSDIVVTPCDHVFHTSCLEMWSAYKMNCPTCRRELQGEL
ncbi:RING-type E3 ubiquitin transferase [Entamoeba marina]